MGEDGVSNKSSKKQALLGTCLQDFSSRTTLHGIQYIGEANLHFIERLCWTLAVILCTTFCAFQIKDIWRKWNTSPVIVSFADRSTSIRHIPFPAITICPLNKIPRSKYDIRAALHERSKMTNITDEHDLLWQTMNLACHDLNDERYKTAENSLINQSHIDAYTQHATSLDDVFDLCLWTFPSEFDCSKLFKPVITDEGQCFTFNMLDYQELFTPQTIMQAPNVSSQKQSSTWRHDAGYTPGENVTSSYPRRVMSTGTTAGLLLVLKSRPDDLQPRCNLNTQSFKMLLHTPSEFPLVFDQNVRLPLDSNVNVAIRPSMDTTSDSLRGSGYTAINRGCYFPEERHLKYFKVYTQKNCELECSADFIREKCGCTPLFMPKLNNSSLPYCFKKGKNCKSFEMLNNYNVEEEHDFISSSGEDPSRCKCLPSCTEYKYDLEMSASQFYASDFEGANILTANISEHRFIVVTMHFKEKQFIRSHRNELYGAVDFLANCGGLLGLFTGFSVLSLIEIIYFASLRLCCHLRNYKISDGEDAELETKKDTDSNLKKY